MAKEQEWDRSVQQAEETIRKSEELARKVAAMKEETDALLGKYGIDGGKISSYFASGAGMTPDQRERIRKEQEQFQQELERDIQAATEQAGLQRKSSSPKPVGMRRRNMV